MRVCQNYLGFLAVSIAVLTGCSSDADKRPKRVPVTGTITYNGKPLANAAIAFVPFGAGANAATGTTNASGNFILTTFKTDDGAIPGTYGISIAAVIDDNRNPDGTQIYSDEDPRWKPPKSSIPVRYSNPKKSELTAEVVAGKPNVFDFPLKD
jgi:hypothetical protein